jgi:hypothetical protein
MSNAKILLFILILVIGAFLLSYGTVNIETFPSYSSIKRPSYQRRINVPFKV